MAAKTVNGNGDDFSSNGPQYSSFANVWSPSGKSEAREGRRKKVSSTKELRDGSLDGIEHINLVNDGELT